MSKRQALFRGGMILSAGNALNQVLGLIRNLLVARLVSPEDFGVAVTFAATVSILEAAAAHGFDKLLIQDKDGEDETLQAMLHSILLLRGILLAAILFLFAPQIATLFGIPEATPAYQALSLIPLMRGLVHLDVKRIQRNLQFTAGMACQLVSQLSGLVIAVGLAWIQGDYRAMLWGLLAQAMVLIIATHVAAQRRYRIGWNAAFNRRAFSFSWPLMVNGLLLTLSSQADRIVVGAAFSLEELAVYGAGSMIAIAIMTLLAKIFGELGLPWVSAVRETPDVYRNRSRQFAAALTLGVIVLLVPLLLAGMDTMRILFGPAYGEASTIMAWLAIAMGLRLLRVWPIVISMSFGDTQNLMRSNIVRTLSIAFLALFVFLDYGLSWVAVAVAIGEGCALVLSYMRLKQLPQSHRVSIASHLRLCLACFVIAFIGAILLEALVLRIALATMIVAAACYIELRLEVGLQKFLHEAIRSILAPIFGKRAKTNEGS